MRRSFSGGIKIDDALIRPKSARKKAPAKTPDEYANGAKTRGDHQRAGWS
jgi:hypothetical protein